jgi:type II secretory pathway predicted ATPase ExeA
MYKEHFGLEKALFSDGIVRDSDVFFGPRQQLVAANLKIALSTRDSIAVLSGPEGVGKTTLASHAVRSATTRLALGWLGSAPLTPHELLEQLLTEFDLSPYKSSRVERLQNWRQFLAEMSITDTRVCVLVENAQDLEPEILRHLGALTSADPNGCPGANIVLTCPALPRELLDAPGLESIKQRIRLSCRLEPLNARDVDAYLHHRAELAGSSFERIFAPQAGAMLHRYSGGIIRVINNLCETALTVAATRREALLTPDLIMRVAVGLLGMEPIPAPAEPAPAKRAAAALSSTGARAPAAAPPATESDKREGPIVHAAAIAAARMMAEEAGIAAASGAETQADSAPPQDPDPEPDLASRVSRLSQGETDSRRTEHGGGDTAQRPRADQASELDGLIEDVAAESVRTRVIAMPASAQTSAPDAIPEARNTARDTEPSADAAQVDQTDLESEDQTETPGSDSVIEFVTDEDIADPFEVDERTINEAVGDFDVQDDLDLPILTDSVDPKEDDVAQAVHSSADDESSLDTDAELASTLAGYTDESSELMPAPQDFTGVHAQLEDIDVDRLGEDPESDTAEEQKQDSVEAFAHAKALEDISNSMAETLFGDAELAQLSATLALAGDDFEATDDDVFELELDDDTPVRSQAL